MIVDGDNLSRNKYPISYFKKDFLVAVIHADRHLADN